MKKVILLLTIVIIIAFVPFKKQININIKAPFYDVCQQLLKVDNWKKWQPDIHKNIITSPALISIKTSKNGFLITSPQQTFNIKYTSVNVFNVDRIIHHVNYKFNYVINPSLSNTNTTIIVSYKINLFKLLVAGLSINDNLNPVIDLKKFMEDPMLYYGFNIYEKQVPESHLLVKSKTVLVKNDRYVVMKNLVDELRGYAEKNNLATIQPVTAEYINKQPDSLQIVIGMPVNQKVKSTNNIIYMHMPAGKVIIGVYKGKYAERQKIYTGMEKYIQNFGLQKQVLPLEKYTDNKLPSSDTDIVNMQIYYPVL